jgi:tetratricopeptide (TPR) repeat protein
LSKIYRAHHNDFRINLALAKCHLKISDYSKADNFFKMAITLTDTPDEKMDIYYNWGFLKKKQNNIAKAKSLFEEGLKAGHLPRTRAKILYELLFFYENEKNSQKIKSTLAELLKIEPDNEQLKKKYSLYEEMNSNSKLSVYMQARPSRFEEICQALANKIEKYDEIVDSKNVDNETLDIIALRYTQKANDYVLFRFIRKGNTIGEMNCRDFYTKMKQKNASAGYLVSNSTFTEGAIKFAEARVMELLDKNQLDKFLNRIKI